MNLIELGIKHKTDKWLSHYYLGIYDSYMSGFRNKPIRFLEIGYGGYGDPYKGGESARMWAEYFTDAEIIVTDITDKVIEDKGYTFKKIDQTDRKAMSALGSFDIIVDDGSHRSADVIASFEIMYPLLKDGGLYIIEDTQTSYWPELSPRQKTTEYFKELTDGLNWAEIRRFGYKPNYYDENIYGIHFFHNLVVVLKGKNTEQSNTVRNE